MRWKRLGSQRQSSYLATHFPHALSIFLVFARSSKSLSQLMVIVISGVSKLTFFPKCHPPDTHIGLQRPAFRSLMLKERRVNFRSNKHLKNNSCAQIPWGFVSTASINYMFCLHGKWTIQIMVWQLSMCARSQGVYCGDNVGNSAGNSRWGWQRRPEFPAHTMWKKPFFEGKNTEKMVKQRNNMPESVCYKK